MGTLVLEMWAPAPASSGGDDGDLFQGLNDAPSLPAKIKKVAYRAPAAQLKNWQPTDLYHSLAVKMFGFRSQFLKCCVPWLRQKVLMSTAVSSCTEGGVAFTRENLVRRLDVEKREKRAGLVLDARYHPTSSRIYAK